MALEDSVDMIFEETRLDPSVYKTQPILYSPRANGGKGDSLYMQSPRASVGEMQSSAGGLNRKYYSGHVPTLSFEDVLRVPLKKDCIPGYSGYLGGIRETYGIGWRKSVIASKNIVDEGKESQDDELFSLHGDEKETLNQQYFGERLKLKRRYAAAIKRLNASGSTQEQLLKVMQSKLQERVSSNSSQVAKLKMVFKNFNTDGSDELDVIQFKTGCSYLNVHLDDTQALALFAFFDNDGNGSISYDEFAKIALVPNPRGGSAIFPKPITTTSKGMYKEERDETSGEKERARLASLETRTISNYESLLSTLNNE